MSLTRSSFVVVSTGFAIWIAIGRGEAVGGVGGGPPGAISEPAQGSAPGTPRVWDDAAIADLEVPLADPKGSPKHVSSDYYYQIPVRPIYRSYPVYAPGRGPRGYIETLKARDPEVVWGTDSAGQAHAPALGSEEERRRAGEIVFDAPIAYSSGRDLQNLGDSAFYDAIKAPLTAEGIFPFERYVVREKGRIELGILACAMCHTRVMANGTIIKGAQGSFALDRALAYEFRQGDKTIAAVRAGERFLFASPWLRPDPQARLGVMSVEEIAAAHDAIPAGVCARHRSSPFAPPHVPDLIGVKERRYLDATGLQQQRSIVDLMRYAALNQGIDDLASFDGFIPAGGERFDTRPDPRDGDRYSDDQLFVLASYVYGLQPPRNPNPFDAVAARGQAVFTRQGCAACHTPPLYTSNKLTPAQGFAIPNDHLRKYDILPTSVRTDPALTMTTRRGTGYYKVPSLKGVWYRSMFGHNGWCETLEDWFDARRLHDDYVPTGWKGAGVVAHRVQGHEFGLSLTSEDKRALIAFLKTL